MNSKKFSANRAAVVSLVFIIMITLLAVLAPFVTKFSYEEQNIFARVEGPSLILWMGTDSLGRDLYSRVLYGARMSLAVGVFTALFALIVGIAIGAAARKRIDKWGHGYF